MKRLILALCCSSFCVLTLCGEESIELDSVPVEEISEQEMFFQCKAERRNQKSAHETRCEVPRHMRATVRYTTPKGIGYNHGYTTIEGFFAPKPLRDAWLPFLDLRGHVFDSGKFAANAGIGLRFVDNTSSSLGTYESPYSTLAAAEAASSPGQIIYVFPGNSAVYNTSDGGAAGLALQNSQMLLGASLSYLFPTTMGIIYTPALATSMLAITNTSGNVITLANDNTISGFSFAADYGNGISGNGILNFSADQNTFVTNVPANSTTE
jgi:hypothetical protein